MICKDVLVESQGRAFCLGTDNIIYTCKECDEHTKQCNDCIAIPKPRQSAHHATYKGYDVEEYGFDIKQVMGMVKKKEFLFGLGAGLVLGLFLFNK